ncbi:MAG TPA: multiheme c-type cytochrome, partial [Kofleriaceae bacterium]|nr:multiheme c-type cytochrome [Kofleriaceae bacterium]
MIRTGRAIRILGGCAALAALAACGDDDRARPIAELQDPATCQECHPRHFQQWSGSMHAYASDDPVFVAMNRRGQRETGGALGTFCVQCHAPMAVKLGLTDGTSFDPVQLPPGARGITCYFCHNVQSITDTHNNGLVLAGDQTMRGGIRDPVSSPAHRSAYDRRMDSDANQSEICGSCHDVVTPRGVALERTYQEWQTTFFSEPDPLHHLTCGACHMASSTDVIADAPGLDVKSRMHGFHEHQWPAIDQALTPFPETDAQAAGIQRDLDPAIAIVSPAPLGSNVQPGGICLDPPDTLSVRIDSIGTAHAWPSGAAQDRRAWLEVIAVDKDGNDVFHSGVVPDGIDPEQINDDTLLGLWDRAFKDDGTPAHFFWDVATVDSSNLLRPPVTLDKNSPAFDHATVKKFSVGGRLADIVKITARVRIRP